MTAKKVVQCIQRGQLRPNYLWESRLEISRQGFFQPLVKDYGSPDLQLLSHLLPVITVLWDSQYKMQKHPLTLIW
jgi:hypothetical protein